MPEPVDPDFPLAFLADHQRVTAGVECAHPDGGCGCEAMAQVCSADDEDWPCERVRAFIAGRIAGLRQAAALLGAAADRHPVRARQELLVMYGNECEVLAGAQCRRLVPAEVFTPRLGLFGVDPGEPPPPGEMEKFVRQTLMERRLRRLPLEPERFVT